MSDPVEFKWSDVISEERHQEILEKTGMRSFRLFDQPLVPGTPLPEPKPIFPRIKLRSEEYLDLATRCYREKDLRKKIELVKDYLGNNNNPDALEIQEIKRELEVLRSRLTKEE